MDTIITIGNFSLKWYSVLITIAVIIAYYMIYSESKRFNIKSEFIFNMMFWTLIFGILGARLYYVIFNWTYYSEHLNEIYKIWNGGLAIHGGIITGALTVIIYCKKYKVKVGRIMDLIIPALLLGQALGRWGNFFNGEAYGTIVTKATLENMKIIPEFVIKNMYINGYYHLPMFYFESLWCFLGFIIALILRRRKYIKKGQLTGFYLMWYGVDRFIIEIFRTDSLMLGNLKVARIVSVIMFILGVMIELVQSRKPKLDDLYNSVETEEIRF